MVHPTSYEQALARVDSLLPPAQGESIARSLMRLTVDAYVGRIGDFLPCDAPFHDFEHAMQATEALLALLQAARQQSLVELDPRQEEIALAAALLHDSGYLKKLGDHSGTGAKYSLIHVGRSCFNAWDLLPEAGFKYEEIAQVQRAICYTAVGVKKHEIDFRSRQEWMIGALVATGDLIGQLAAQNYPDRLADLFLEFQESATFSRLSASVPSTHRTVGDLLRGTEKFFVWYVRPMLENEWCGVYHFLDRRDGSNAYMERIHRNLERVKLLGQQL